MPEPVEQSEQMRKIFVGSLDFKADDDDLKEFYSQFGEVTNCIVVKDKQTSKSRGFGFVTYKASSMVDEAMKNRPHHINGRQTLPKRAVPREEAGSPTAGASIQKLFIGGIKDKSISKEDLDDYFGKYGKIKDSVVMVEKETGKSRGFGFVEFDDYDPVDKVLLEKPHQIKGHNVDVKKAAPREGDGVKGVRGGFAAQGITGGMGGGFGFYGGMGGLGQNYGQHFGGGPMQGFGGSRMGPYGYGGRM